ncbi:C-type lectin domain family 4 member A isoform X3 [Rhinolophus sinicus]|uniref:C-type lectin domain family 4 member A isoform X3 n=1 Tax=Rhinolophus sinicus TaxID=89399 RepID=UPI003D7AFB86
MTSEITYAEVRFQNESKSSGTKSEPPAVFFQKYSQLLKEKKTVKEFTHTSLDCMKENLTMEDKDWSCCPKGWEPFSLNCYFISTKNKNWNESEKNCSGMQAHLLVINTKAEQEFITGKLEKRNAYFVGLSDPEGTRHWQWVDQTPYNRSATFWHQGEPSDPDERCAVLNAPQQRWGLNDIPCDLPQRSICEMMKIYL